MTEFHLLWCCACRGKVYARLTNGAEIYPHRKDLADLPFWRCDGCGNHVGCHHKTAKPTTPLGNIPTPELRKARGHIHKILDPIWKQGKMRRGDVYQEIAERLGERNYHTAEIKDIETARQVYRICREISVRHGI